MTTAVPLSLRAEAELERRRRARSEVALSAPVMPLRKFVAEAWHLVDPTSRFIPNWHVDAICEHLEAIASGDLRRLVINIPPGHAKSMIVSVLWPAWMWHWMPEWRSIFTSYDAKLSVRDAVNSRTVLTSDWFRETFNPKWRFTVDQNVKSYYTNDRTGQRFSTSLGGASTGFRGHCVVVDDPLSVKDANNKNAIDEANRIWDQVMSSRLNDMERGAHVIIMQRVNTQDLTGHVLAKRTGYEHLSLPSEFDPKKRSTTVTISGKRWSDPRTLPGELLFPQKFPESVLAKAKIDLGSMQYAAQHGQSPVPSSGGVFKREWFPRYRKRELPPVWAEKIQSWDLTFKKKEESDYVVGDIYGRLGANVYLLHHDRERRDFVESRAAILAMHERFPDANLKLIEDKANGPAILASLRDVVPGIVGVSDPGGVISQAWAVQPLVEAGQVWIPASDEAPWIEDWLDEVCGFPKFGFDDRVAAFTQALQRLQSHMRRGLNESTLPALPMSETATMAAGKF